MKIYIAGKITGDANYRKKFQYAQEKLEAGGTIVLNPAFQPEGMSSADYMRICFAMMDSSDMGCLKVFAFTPRQNATKEKESCQTEYN